MITNNLLNYNIMGFLPTKKSEKKTDDPKNLIVFGLPKVLR